LLSTIACTSACRSLPSLFFFGIHLLGFFAVGADAELTPCGEGVFSWAGFDA